MPEENKPKSPEDYHRASQEKEEQRRQRMENVRQQTIKRLNTDAAIQQYFLQFSPHSIESFISGYATWRSIFTEYGDMYENISEKHYIEYFERAENCLKEIQLKKLFHLRCEWGANLITLEGIDTTWDFLPWSDNILNCPFLTPINSSEFECYLDYARSDQFMYEKYFSWSDVESTDNGNRENVEYNNWFHYHNTHTDSGKYLVLPDIRGEKEWFYRKLYWDEQERIREKKYETGELQRPVTENRPYLSCYQHEQLLDFLHRFEDAETIRSFENYQQYGNRLTAGGDENDNDYLDERVESIMYALSLMKDVRLPVEANSDWRTALIVAWEKFEKAQTIAHLPAAYDNYLFRIENKIQFPKEDKYDHAKLAEDVRQQVLRGRELNGEPADLNF